MQSDGLNVNANDKKICPVALEGAAEIDLIILFDVAVHVAGCCNALNKYIQLMIIYTVICSMHAIWSGSFSSSFLSILARLF